jgi:CopG family nickel-responsive transcriptional regulator
MAGITRFSVSMDSALLDRFDRMRQQAGYENRSEALRDIIRDALVKEEWQRDEEIVGTITLVYDHHHRELSDQLMQVQHDCLDAIVSTMHIHLDHDNCLEVIVVRGKSSKVQGIADALIRNRGVKHGKLSATTTGRRLR